MVDAFSAHSLHSSPTLIGREHELGGLLAALERGRRLVVLVGIGGIGKTRLALEATRRLEASSARRVIRCSVAQARGLRDVCSAFADAIGVPLPAAADDAAALAQLGACADALGDAVVVLDNVEHLVDIAVRCLAVWMEAAPRTQWLATSRLALGMRGEIVLDVPPLGLPPDGGDPAESGAVQVVVACAKRVGVTVSLSGAEGDAVIALVRRLDGIPLALELAAARLPLMSPAALLRRLDASAAALSRSPRAPGDPHASYHGALDWSWSLLDDAERRALACLSVFDGHFSVDAAEAVLGETATPPLDRLQSLREHSLLALHADEGPSGERRLRLLRPIRDFASQKLAGLGLSSEARARHRAYFVAHAERLAAGFQRNGGADWIHRLAADRDNFWNVVDDTDPSAQDDVEQGLRILVASEALAATRGGSGAHVAAIEHLLATRAAARLPIELQCRARIAASRLQRLDLGARHDPRVLDEAIAAAAAARLAGVEAEARAVRAAILCSSGLVDEGRDALTAAAASARDEGLPTVEVFALAIASSWERVRGRYASAAELGARGVEAARAAGHAHALGFVLVEVGALEAALGQHVEAQRHLREALEIQRAMGDVRMSVMTMLHLSSAVSASGDLEATSRMLSDAAASARRIGATRLELFATGYQGVAELELLRLETATELLERAHRRAVEWKADHFEALFGGFLALARAAAGRLDLADPMLARAGETTARGDESLRVALCWLRGAVDAVRARVLRERGCEDEAAAARIAAARAIGEALEATGEGPGGGDSLIARRVARAFHPELVPRAGERSRTQPPSPTAPELVVSCSGRLCTPDGRVSDLAHKPALRRLLLFLVEQRLRLPGVPATVDDLIAATWPGERMSARSARNRLHVSVNRLRALGLRETIVAKADGYCLDPGLRIAVGED